MASSVAIVVDEDDNPIGSGRYDDIQANGDRHRVVRVMVEDDSGNVLLQKRSRTLTLFPGCWDNSAAGHVDVGEEYSAAAQRELAEETGISAVKLQEIKHYKTDGTFEHRILKRWNCLYKAVVRRGVTLRPQVGEVETFRWVTRKELGDLIRTEPGAVSDGLLEAYEIMYA